MFRVPGKLIKALFIERKNRFVLIAKHDEKMIRCHLPNPGRLTLILHPKQTKLLLRPAPPKSNRKTEATVVAAIIEDEVINLDTTIFQPFLSNELEKGPISELRGWNIVGTEVAFENTRFDFILENPMGTKFITEVKSTTRVVDEVACFPDAVSKRATKHVKHLMHLAEEGNDVLIFFIVYRQSSAFKPCIEIDEEFTSILNTYLQEYRGMAVQARGVINQENENEYYSIDLELTNSIEILPSNQW